MSLETEQIREQLHQFASRTGPKVILPATVTAVNEDDTIAVVFSDGSSVDDARLRSVVKAGNKVLLIPKVGTVVLVGRIENSDEFIVIAADEIEDVIFEIGGKFKIRNEQESLLNLIKDLIQANIDERHMTNTGPSIKLTPDSLLKYTQLKTRFEKLLSDT